MTWVQITNWDYENPEADNQEILNTDYIRLICLKDHGTHRSIWFYNYNPDDNDRSLVEEEFGIALTKTSLSSRSVKEDMEYLKQAFGIKGVFGS